MSCLWCLFSALPPLYLQYTDSFPMLCLPCCVWRSSRHPPPQNTSIWSLIRSDIPVTSLTCTDYSSPETRSHFQISKSWLFENISFFSWYILIDINDLFLPLQTGGQSLSTTTGHIPVPWFLSAELYQGTASKFWKVNELQPTVSLILILFLHDIRDAQIFMSYLYSPELQIMKEYLLPEFQMNTDFSW